MEMSTTMQKLREDLGWKDDSPAVFGLPDSGLEDETYEPIEREPAVFEIEPVESDVPDLNQSDSKTDYVKARNITHTLLGMTGDAVAHALRLAKETDNVRAYSSFNELVGTMRTLTQDLLAMQKTYKEITKDRPEVLAVVQNTTINGDVGAVGVGAPGGVTDILDRIEEAKRLMEGQYEIIDDEELGE